MTRDPRSTHVARYSITTDVATREALDQHRATTCRTRTEQVDYYVRCGLEADGWRRLADGSWAAPEGR